MDIKYKPTKNPEVSPLCSFTQDTSKAYINFSNVKDKVRRAHGCYECYYCRKFFLKEDRHKRPIQNCAGVPGLVYNFDKKKKISFQDNFYVKGDIPFLFYFDFKTTAPTDNCFDSERKEMFVVSFALIVAFHPELNLNRIIIQRTYAHSLQELTALN